MTPRTLSALVLFLGLALAASASAPMVAPEGSGGGFGYHDRSRQDTTLYESSFDSGFEDWTSVDNTAQLSTWHVDPFNPVDGTWNWWSADAAVGGYVNHSLLYLEFPPIDLSATANPELSFDLYYALEDPESAPEPYDAWDACHVEVRMSAGSWEILEPTAPAYDAENAFCFGEIFGLELTAGWAGQSGGWLEGVCDLTDYRSSATRVRFAMCSDDGTAFPDDPTLTGMQLDNIQIADGDNILMQNDADGIDFPGPTLHYSGVSAAGDNWQVSEDAASPPFSLRCNIENQDVPIINSAVSPWIPLPANYELAIDFWMKCDMLDADGDGDQALEDYFLLEYSDDGAIWEELFYDYYDDETGLGQWYHFVDGGGHDRPTDISFLGGQTVMFRFRVVTDGNHDGGTGSGMFIDDFRIQGDPQLAQDAGIVQFRLPYPRTLFRPIPAELWVQNFGSEPIDDVEWGVYIDNNPTAYTGTLDIGLSEVEVAAFDLVPDEESLHFPEGRLLSGDQFEDNDVLEVPSYIVRPEGVLELANDYAWDVTDSEFMHTTGAGDDVGIAYAQGFQSPELPEDYAYMLDSLRLRFASFNIPPDESADWRLEVYDGDPETGTLVHSSDHVYAPTYAGGNASADWETVDLSSLNLYFEGEFWIAVETLELGDYQTPGDPRPVPNVTVVDRSWEDQASGTLVDGSLQMLQNHQYNFHTYGHEFDTDVVLRTLPESTGIRGAWPNPFNPATRIAFVLDHAAPAELKVYNLLGREVAVLASGHRPAGNHEALFDGSALSSGVYVLHLSVDGLPSDTRKVLLMK